MSIDASAYYDTYLKPLYEVNPIYKVDSMLFNLKNENQFDELVNNTFFQDISQFDLMMDERSTADERASNMSNTRAQRLPTRYVVSYDANPKKILVEEVNPESQYFFVSLTKAPKVTSPARLLKVMSDDVGSGTDLRNHETFDTYMKNLVDSVCALYFRNAIITLSSRLSMETSRNNYWRKGNNTQQALYNFAYLSRTEINILISSLSKISFDVLNNIVKAYIEKNLSLNANSTAEPNKMNFINPNFIKDLAGRFSGPLYYAMRKELVAKLQYSKSYSNDYVVKLTNMLIVDTYIKTFYPSMIYDYIKVMMNVYSSNGDFVNARIALLAKVMYTYRFFRKVVTSYEGSNEQTSTLNNFITKTVGNLDKYLKNVNNLEIDSLNTGLLSGGDMKKKIQTTVQKTSKEVVDKNVQIQELKKQIRQNQLSMRNILYNTEQIKKQYSNKIVEFSLWICLLLVVIITCSVLLFLASETNKLAKYVEYIAGAVAFAVLFTAIIKLIWSMLGKK